MFDTTRYIRYSLLQFSRLYDAKVETSSSYNPTPEFIDFSVSAFSISFFISIINSIFRINSTAVPIETSSPNEDADEEAGQTFQWFKELWDTVGMNKQNHFMRTEVGSYTEMFVGHRILLFASSSIISFSPSSPFSAPPFCYNTLTLFDFMKICISSPRPLGRLQKLLVLR